MANLVGMFTDTICQRRGGGVVRAARSGSERAGPGRAVPCSLRGAAAGPGRLAASPLAKAEKNEAAPRRGVGAAADARQAEARLVAEPFPAWMRGTAGGTARSRSASHQIAAALVPAVESFPASESSTCTACPVAVAGPDGQTRDESSASAASPRDRGRPAERAALRRPRR